MPRLHYRYADGWVDGVDIFYPVGAIYMSTNDTSPAEMFGGTWSALDDGRFLRPMGSYNSLGGTTEHYHYTGTGYYAPEGRLDITSMDMNDNGVARRVTIDGFHASFYQSSFNKVDKYEAHTQDPTYKASTLPIYRTVYCWIRTA